MEAHKFDQVLQTPAAPSHQLILEFHHYPTSNKNNIKAQTEHEGCIIWVMSFSDCGHCYLVHTAQINPQSMSEYYGTLVRLPRL